jgi:flavin-dependent dehydrogenase
VSYDAIIIGAGPAGSTAAIQLARMGWSVALVERTAFPRRKVCGEFISATSAPVIDDLGIGDEWRSLAGPEVKRLALFSGDRIIEAPMPAGNGLGFGRALGRDVLDGLLVRRAVDLGVDIFHPWRAVAIKREDGLSSVRVTSGDLERTLRAPVVIAAHGSWEPGPLPSHLEKLNTPKDFLGFKAHFRGATLSPDVMPLLAFPGGYGGIVWSDDGRLSLSCCIRRDHLETLRKDAGSASAATVLHRHLVKSSRGIRQAIREASLESVWLAAGPIRPGIRAGYADDIFRIGNAAGESHPIIAEGISMAMQSGWLLARELAGGNGRSLAGRAQAGARYEKGWRRQFAGRIRAADLFARVALLPLVTEVMGGLAARVPSLLTVGANLSGKTKRLPS